MDKKELKKDLNLESQSEVKDFIQNTESGIYTGKNTEGEELVVFLQKGKGMNVRKFQDNGWIRVHEYDEDGWFVTETYER